MKDEIIIDGVIYIKKPEENKVERRNVWVEFDCNTKKPRAVEDSYDEIELSWSKERRGLGTRYLRTYTKVSKGERVLSEDDVSKALANFANGMCEVDCLKELGFGGSE